MDNKWLKWGMILGSALLMFYTGWKAQSVFERDPKAKPKTDVQVAPDTTAQREAREWKEKYQWVVDHPQIKKIPYPVGVPPETCNAWIESYKAIIKQKDSLLALYDSTATSLLAKLNKSWLRIVNAPLKFTDSTYGEFLKIGGHTYWDQDEMKLAGPYYDWRSDVQVKSRNRFLLEGSISTNSVGAELLFNVSKNYWFGAGIETDEKKIKGAVSF